MKWAVAQLRKLKKPYSFEYDFDLMNALTNSGDVLECHACHIDGIMREYGVDEYQFDLHIELDLVMQCAVSLEPVDVSLDFDTTVRYSYDDDDSSDNYLILKETVDLDEAVLSEIILNIPYRVVKEGYEDLYNEPIEEEKPVNSSFAILKDLYGGEDKWSHHSEEFLKHRKEWDVHI